MEKLPISPINPCAMALHVTHPSRNIAIRIFDKNLISSHMHIKRIKLMGINFLQAILNSARVHIGKIKSILPFVFPNGIIYLWNRRFQNLSQNQPSTQIMIPTISIYALQNSVIDGKVAIDYQKFKSSLGSQVEWTAMNIHLDWDDRPYAQYEISHDVKKSSKARLYLTDYRLYLDDPVNSEFYIYKVYNQFSNGERLGEVKPASLEEYLSTNLPREIINDTKKIETADLVRGDKTAQFKLMEFIYLKNICTEIDPKNTMFIPIPNFKGNKLIGMVYAIFDKQKVDIHAINEFLVKINR